MRRYDEIVVGGGISGLTMSLLLAMCGRRVLLLERGKQIGGSLCRFSRNGIHFDTGFHFTGGLHEKGILRDMLSLLGLQDAIEPMFVTEARANRFVFEAAGKTFEHPVGIDNVKKRFKEYFPADASAIESYLDQVVSVCQRTPSLNIFDNVIGSPNLEEDYISLEDALNRLTDNPLLKGLFSGYAMCYGARPVDISFANHCRMVLNFYESVGFVRDGGDGFINAFMNKLAQYDVDVRCGTYITELADVEEGKVKRFVLNTGEEVEAEGCLFTIHPQEILNLLPEKQYSKAFASRIREMEPSAGFFSVFATLKEGYADPFDGASIVSLFPDADVNRLLDPAYAGTPALVIIRPPLQGPGDRGKGICILEPSFVPQVEPWADSRLGRRPAGYADYKQQRVEGIREHIASVYPAARESLDFLGSASMLTYRDYLYSPDGSAYGVKQKMGQFNIIGRLPLRNLFAAGQSALLPGIIGAMMSSLIVGRAYMGKERYGRLLSETVCN